MKDLIIIGAHCPDDERTELLHNCIKSLQKIRDDFDILICSHTHIPDYIVKKVDYSFYDKNNDIITDLEYLNQPWFLPQEGTIILSTYVSGYSTYLAVYRILISGLGIAKTYGYNKVHYIEYDSEFNDFTDLYENSKLLDENDSVLIKKGFKEFENNIVWGMGFFMSFRIDTMSETFLKFDKDKLLKLLFDSRNKTNEKITQDILSENGRKIFIKDYYEVIKKDNKYMLSDNTEKEDLNSWCVPYYSPEKDSVYLIVWNQKQDTPLNVRFIINQNKVIEMNEVKRYTWRNFDIGKIEDINSIETIVDNKLKNRIVFDDKLRDIFKKTNYSKKG